MKDGRSDRHRDRDKRTVEHNVTVDPTTRGADPAPQMNIATNQSGEAFLSPRHARLQMKLPELAPARSRGYTSDLATDNRTTQSAPYSTRPDTATSVLVPEVLSPRGFQGQFRLTKVEKIKQQSNAGTAATTS